jgi:DNA processing protein
VSSSANVDGGRTEFSDGRIGVDADYVVDSTNPNLDVAINERLLLPHPLYMRGDLSLLSGTRRVAIVGTRDATSDGIRRARRLARELVAHDIVIVSGLAAGIDTAAHHAAIESNGRTVAVLGTPLNRVFPKENAELQKTIGKNHLLVSQFATGARIDAKNYTGRNRTMALLAHASVVVECGDTSGSLSQASETMRHHRPLFLLRSAANNPSLQWPKRFVERGAYVLDSVEQIFEVLKWPRKS